MSVESAKHARELLLKEYRGALSTQSKAMPGFPFGSVVPYCLDEQGRPLILISRIAQHTHNLRKDPKCSLMVGERGAEDVQAVGRLTYLAEAEQLTEAAAIAAAAERYYRYFPEARGYDTAHDFDFWVLNPVRHRYIGGFGAIHWLDDVWQLQAQQQEDQAIEGKLQQPPHTAVKQARTGLTRQQVQPALHHARRHRRQNRRAAVFPNQHGQPID